MEEDEREKYMQQRHKKIVACEAKLIQKQQNEMSALRKKIEATMNERLKQREYEHNKYFIICYRVQVIAEIPEREEGAGEPAEHRAHQAGEAVRCETL